ncbi:MAG: hypothetical protein ACPHKR_01800 [bacterium]
MSLPEDLKKEFPELEQPESLWETLERDLNELLAQHSSAKRTNVQTGFLKKSNQGKSVQHESNAPGEQWFQNRVPFRIEGSPETGG